jgi:hypothetical protein
VWFRASTTIAFFLVFAYGTPHDVFPLSWCWHLPPSSFVQIVGGGDAWQFCCGLQIDDLAFPKGMDCNINKERWGKRYKTYPNSLSFHSFHLWIHSWIYQGIWECVIYFLCVTLPYYENPLTWWVWHKVQLLKVYF